MWIAAAASIGVAVVYLLAFVLLSALKTSDEQVDRFLSARGGKGHAGSKETYNMPDMRFSDEPNLGKRGAGPRSVLGR